MTTRAKFSCKKIEQTNDTYRVTLEPVSSGSDENRDFFKWTPGGKIELQVVSSQTASQFKEGYDYYVDFTEVLEKLTADESDDDAGELAASDR